MHNNARTDTKPQTAKPLIKKAGGLPSDPAEAIQDMMGMIDDLRAIYLEESQALTNSDASGFMSLQPLKVKTAKKYQRSVFEMISRKEEIKNVDPALKQRLEMLHSNFTRDIEANKMALSRMQATIGRLKNTINKAARDAVNNEAALSYGQCGTMQRGNKKVISTGLIESV